MTTPPEREKPGDEALAEAVARGKRERQAADLSVVLFRPHFMLASEGHPMKVRKHQRLLSLPSPPNLPCGATNQGTYYGVWWADAFAVT